MRAAIWIRNRIRERQNLVVIAVVILEHHIDKNFVTLSSDDDGLGVQDLLVLSELPNELFNSMLVKESFGLWRVDAFISERDLETGIEKRQFTQACRQSFELKLGRDGENRRIRQEGDECARRLLVLDLSNDCEFVGRFAFGKSHVVDL